jgi:hypothetical protein
LFCYPTNSQAHRWYIKKSNTDIRFFLHIKNI